MYHQLHMQITRGYFKHDTDCLPENATLKTSERHWASKLPTFSISEHVQHKDNAEDTADTFSVFASA